MVSIAESLKDELCTEGCTIVTGKHLKSCISTTLNLIQVLLFSSPRFFDVEVRSGFH